jgi:hypothetical protein
VLLSDDGEGVAVQIRKMSLAAEAVVVDQKRLSIRTEVIRLAVLGLVV